MEQARSYNYIVILVHRKEKIWIGTFKTMKEAKDHIDFTVAHFQLFLAAPQNSKYRLLASWLAYTFKDQYTVEKRLCDN
jgi:hypothetical protein